MSVLVPPTAVPLGGPPARSSASVVGIVAAVGCGGAALAGLCAVLFVVILPVSRDEASPPPVAPVAPAVAPVAPSPAPISATTPVAPSTEAARAQVAPEPVEASAHFSSIACLLGDVNGDGAREIGGLIARGRERQVRLAMIDGAAGTVVWETAPMSDDELRVLCLGDEHIGAMDQRAFELVVVPTRGLEGEVRRTLSDELDRFGVGPGCVTLRTADRNTLGVSLDDGADARCAARASIRPHIGEEVTVGYVHAIISTIRRPVVAEHEGARYELRTRRPGTPFLEVTARSSGRERWSRPLNVVPVGGEAIGYLAIAAAPEGPVVAGVPRGTPTHANSITLVGLDAATGAERFTSAINGYGIAGMFHNGRYAIVSTRRALVAVRSDTGAVAWQL